MTTRTRTRAIPKTRERDSPRAPQEHPRTGTYKTVVFPLWRGEEGEERSGEEKQVSMLFVVVGMCVCYCYYCYSLL